MQLAMGRADRVGPNEASLKLLMPGRNVCTVVPLDSTQEQIMFYLQILQYFNNYQHPF